MTGPNRRQLLAAPALLLPAAARAQAQAQAQASYAAGQTVTLVNPYAAGGASDVIGRVLTEGLAARLGTNVIMEHRPGASTSLAARQVARARPDGLSLLMGTIVTYTMAPLALKNPGYNPVEDFAHVGMVTDSIYVLCANPKWQSLAEILAAAKADPKRINYASWGIGTTAHLPMVDLGIRAGVEMTHVPYNGSPPALIDTIAGRTDLMFALLAACKGHIESGRLRPLATCALERAALLPALPTVAELGFPGFRVGGWYGVSAPKETPAPVLAQLVAATTATMASPEARRVLDPVGMFEQPSGPAPMLGRIAEELRLHAALMQRSGVVPE